jgi:CSLREA domain-containing protein
MPLKNFVASIAPVVMTTAFSLALKTAPALATTYTVNTLDDSSGNGDCSLRDAINATNGKPTSGSSCTTARSSNDTIQFSVIGTITLASTLPQIQDSRLAINGPAAPGIRIDGGGAVSVMLVADIATANLKNLTIAHGSGIWGGLENEGTLTITNSTFSDNTGHTGCCGGIDNDGGTLTVISSTFSHNTAALREFFGGAASYGGGIMNQGLGAVSVANSTFSGNAAGVGGGIMNEGGSTLIVTNCTFSGNTLLPGAAPGAFIGGGGIFNTGILSVSSSTFSGNSANFGGGVSNFINDSVPFKASFKSTILAASGGGNCYGAPIADAGYNISDDAACGFAAVGSLNNTDPVLDPAGLQNNGGPTQTIALSSESPAIDAIPVSDCTDQNSNPIHTDQRGALRPDPGEVACDIGAYEFADFAGQANCVGKSNSALAHQYGGLSAAASAYGFPTVKKLEAAVRRSCQG